MGVVSFCRESFWPHNTTLFVTDFCGNEPLFVFFALKTINFQAFNSGSAQAQLNRNYLHNIQVWCPPLLQQRAIAHILGTLDDKIELNRRMIETLEEMARALFKSWFVDFGPVRRKAEGRDPGLPKHLADLFPSRFVDSELGEIPEGWRVGQWRDTVNLVKDSRNPGDEPATTFQHFSLPAYDEGKEPKRETGADIKSLKFIVGPEDLLLSKLNPAIERVWHIDLSPSAPAVCSTEFLVLRPRAPFARTYVYCAARSAPFRTELKGLVTGTSNSHQRVQPETMLDLGTVLPPPSVLSSFESVAAPILGRTHAARRETRSLTDARDALLPKLISGELRVRDAQRIVEAAT